MRPMEFYAEFILFIMCVPVAALLGYALGHAIRNHEGKVIGGLITGVILGLLGLFLIWNPNKEPQASYTLVLMVIIAALLFEISGIVLMIVQNSRRRLVQPILQRQAIRSGAVINRAMNPNSDHRRP